jgi:tetratricopeptide (TPR) repeat protein
MIYEKIDNDELLRLTLDSINQERHADALSMLKVLLERDANHAFATYLLAAEHAQLGMMDRAEEGFKKAVKLAPDFLMARFQLGQLYLVKNEAGLAKEMFAPIALLPAGHTLAAYAKGLIAAANDDIIDAVAHLDAGLACEQEIPALAEDMKSMRNNLLSLSAVGSVVEDEHTGQSAATSLLLRNYGKAGN